MRIFVDDGSTNIKLAWMEDGAVKTLISPNSFKPEWSMTLLTDSSVPASANYEIDGEKYSFDQLSPDALDEIGMLVHEPQHPPVLALERLAQPGGRPRLGFRRIVRQWLAHLQHGHAPHGDELPASHLQPRLARP